MPSLHTGMTRGRQSGLQAADRVKVRADTFSCSLYSRLSYEKALFPNPSREALREAG